MTTDEWRKKKQRTHGMNGNTLFSKCRTTSCGGGRTTCCGGGVVLYIRDKVPSYPLTCSRPSRMSVGEGEIFETYTAYTVCAVAVCVCGVFTTTVTTSVWNHWTSIIASFDLLRTMYPDIGLIVLWEVNHLRVHDICLDKVNSVIHDMKWIRQPVPMKKKQCLL